MSTTFTIADDYDPDGDMSGRRAARLTDADGNFTKSKDGSSA